MQRYEAPGLTGDWLNAWLAAVGITVLLPDVKLAWTDDPIPSAVFSVSDGDPLPTRIASALPSLDELDELVIARQRPDCAYSLGQKADQAAFAERADLARRFGDFALAAIVTDLAVDDVGLPRHSPFDPGRPRGVTFHEALSASRENLATPVEPTVEASLSGRATRVAMNGLGFDFRRIVASSQPSDSTQMSVMGQKHSDPCLEVLAFFGLALFPTRGDGTHLRPRGWDARGALRWPVWAPELDRWAIDAVIDLTHTGRPNMRRAGATGLYGSVSFNATKNDRTRGYASERLW